MKSDFQRNVVSVIGGLDVCKNARQASLGTKWVQISIIKMIGLIIWFIPPPGDVVKEAWQIIIAFFISRGFIKTGLGARIGYRLC